jgi:hypothetical protein
MLGLVAILVIALAVWRRKRAAKAATSVPSPSPSRAPAGAVTIDETGVSNRLTSGGEERIAWDDIDAIHIETVSGGLNADDVSWVLSKGGTGVVRVAQTAPGADLLIARLQQLPGFRYEPMINSMITTEATRFVVWER